MYSGAVIGLLLADCFIWKLIDQKRKPAAAPQARQEREKVAGPADIAADVTDPHLAKKSARNQSNST